ncbi:MAG: putative Ig domain-containing protein [Gammaproteobacteria bacterium]
MQTFIKRHAIHLASLIVISATLAACGGGGSMDSLAEGAATGGSQDSSGAGAPVAPGSETPATPEVTLPQTPSAPVVGPPATLPTHPVIAPPAGTDNHAPTISGSAIPAVMTGQAYNFVPAAADTDGDALQFAISSKPSWATFDVSTGRLWGVPTGAQVGSYEQIEISVTDGKASTTLPRFSISVTAGAPTMRNVLVSWQPPTANSDGSTLTDLRGYRILYGTQPGVYTGSVKVDGAGFASYTIENLQSGTKYYFAMVAVNSAGAESDNSQEAVVDLT